MYGSSTSQGAGEMAPEGLHFSIDAAHALGMLELNVHETARSYRRRSRRADAGTGLAWRIQAGVSSRSGPTCPSNPGSKQGARKSRRSEQRTIPTALRDSDAIDFHSPSGKNVERGGNPRRSCGDA